jgi:alpha amylase-like protein
MDMVIPVRPHPQLYEIHTWIWLEQLSRQYGRRLTLGSVPDSEWDELLRRGFDLIWLMGVWERSPESRRVFQNDSGSFPQYERALPGWTLGQLVGSPYAVRTYRPDPRIGTWSDLDRVREKLRARGMRLILDFVPNHTALDHPWVQAHPEYYVQGAPEDARSDPEAFFLAMPSRGGTLAIARARDPYFPPWRDAAQINIFEPAARLALLGELREIARHCDGVRCDMAMLVLNDVFSRIWRAFLTTPPPREEFWAQAFPVLPGFLWIAEVYWEMETQLQQLGFDFTYDKVFYDRLRATRPREFLAHLQAGLDIQSRMVRFLENHDEPRSAAVFGAERLPAAATLLATLPGMRLYHHGQLTGAKIHVPIALSDAAVEPADPAVAAIYDKTLSLSNEDVFHTGDWKLLETRSAGDESWENLIAYRWRSAQAYRLIVVNLGAGTSQGRIPLAGEISPTANYTLLDRWNDAVYSRTGKEMTTQGIYVRLDAFRVHWFDVSPA